MVVKLIIYILIIALLVVGYVKYLESTSIFFPAKDVEYFPSLIGLSFENIYIQTQDKLKINGWFIPHPDAKYTVLFLHGNAENIGTRLDKLKLLHEAKVNIFIVDFRGYGESEGKPTERGCYLDSQAAYHYLVNIRQVPPENIILYGESLGGAVAVDLASRVKIKGLILEGAFTNISDMAKVIYPFVPSFLISVKFDSLAKIKNVEAAKLFIHSRDDEVVPFKLGKKLYAAAKEPKKFCQIIGDHNIDFLDFEKQCLPVIEEFINGLN